MILEKESLRRNRCGLYYIALQNNEIWRIDAMEVRINIDVQKVDNGFILFRDIYGLKLKTKLGDEGREIYVGFPQVRARLVELLKSIATELEEAITEAIPGKE